ncbi:MAG: hypothetical protein ACPG9A_12865, partial [Paracoccaceae bacterium]
HKTRHQYAYATSPTAPGIQNQQRHPNQNESENVSPTHAIKGQKDIYQYKSIYLHPLSPRLQSL